MRPLPLLLDAPDTPGACCCCAVAAAAASAAWAEAVSASHCAVVRHGGSCASRPRASGSTLAQAALHCSSSPTSRVGRGGSARLQCAWAQAWLTSAACRGQGCYKGRCRALTRPWLPPLRRIYWLHLGALQASRLNVERLSVMPPNFDDLAAIAFKLASIAVNKYQIVNPLNQTSTLLVATLHQKLLAVSR